MQGVTKQVSGWGRVTLQCRHGSVCGGWGAEGILRDAPEYKCLYSRPSQAMYYKSLKMIMGKLVPCAQPSARPRRESEAAMPQYRTLLARMPSRAHDGTDGGDPALGVPTSLRARCTCPGLQGFWLRSVRDLGAAACGEAESTNRSAASHEIFRKCSL